MGEEAVRNTIIRFTVIWLIFGLWSFKNSSQEPITDFYEMASYNYQNTIVNPLMHEDQVDKIIESFKDTDSNNNDDDLENQPIAPLSESLIYNSIHCIVRTALKNKELLEEGKIGEYLNSILQALMVVIPLVFFYSIIPKSLRMFTKYSILLVLTIVKHPGDLGFFREGIKLFLMMIFCIIYSWSFKNIMLRGVMLGVISVIWEYYLFSWF